MSDTSTLTTMSPAWISATTESGRFVDYRWDKKELVSITTLDRLIDGHGAPAFCKIDVEGFELEVLQGLSQPLNVLSFEFAREVLDDTGRCIQRLEEPRAKRFNYSPGASMKLGLSSWVNGGDLDERLRRLSDELAFGDVYALFH